MSVSKTQKEEARQDHQRNVLAGVFDVHKKEDHQDRLGGGNHQSNDSVEHAKILSPPDE